MPNFSMAMSNSNATLTYSASGKSFAAQVRVSKASYAYGMRSTESHARLHRAFYPHRRALGEFSITVDAIHYQEFKTFMRWLSNYSNALFTGQMGDQRGATLMEVQIPSRNFHKYGILTTGIDDHDQAASMLFRQRLGFMTLKDFNDHGTAIVSTKSISEFHPPEVDPQDALAFFPVSVSNYKDTDSNLYNGPSVPQPPPIHGRPGRGGGVGFE